MQARSDRVVRVAMFPINMHLALRVAGTDFRLVVAGTCAETQTDKDAENFEVSWACQVFDADMPTYRQGVCVRARVRSWFQKIMKRTLPPETETNVR